MIQIAMEDVLEVSAALQCKGWLHGAGEAQGSPARRDCCAATRRLSVAIPGWVPTASMDIAVLCQDCCAPATI